MKTRWMIGLGLTTAMLSAVAAADTGKLLSDAQNKVGALARFYCTMQDEQGSRTVEGQAVCITADPAVLVTVGLDVRIPPDSLSDFILVPANAPAKQIKAQLLGVDPETNIGFIRATEPHNWTVVQFAPKANLAIGQEVVSVGLMGRETDFQAYLGTGYISAMLHTPEETAYVTGGKLTAPGSPVFAADGRAIGLVGVQRFTNFQTIMNGRVTGIPLRGLDEAAFFMPVDEFAHVIVNIPSSPAQVRRLPWIGVLGFSGVSKEVSDIMKLDSPGVMVEGVVAGGPAAKAGLTDRDVVLAINGEKFPVTANPDITAAALQRKLFRMTAGTKVTLSLRRGDATKDYSVTLEAIPQLPHEAKRYLSRTLGFLAREKVDLDRLTDKGPTATVPGLIVLGADGPAGNAGLREGDLITTVNAVAVTTTAGLKDAVEKATSANTPVALVVRRGDQTQTITISPAATQPAEMPGR